MGGGGEQGVCVRVNFGTALPPWAGQSEHGAELEGDARAGAHSLLPWLKTLGSNPTVYVRFRFLAQ